MVNLKTAALAVLALGISGAASAGMYAAPPAMGCTAGNVTVPCEKKGWSVGVEGLLVKVGDVGQVTTTSTTSGSATTTNYDSLDPAWDWAFRVEAAYMFGTGNDVNVNWTHFTNLTSQSAVATGVTGIYVTDVTDANTVDTDIDDKFDAVNLEFGQMVNFGEKVGTRFHAGLQFADIRQTLAQSSYVSTAATTYNFYNTESKYTGIGPRAGADTNYCFGNGFSIFGDFAAALLIGDLDTTTTTTTNVSGSQTASTSATSSVSNAFVPEAEAKLGLAYTKPMAEGDLRVEAGYELTNYWDASTINGATVNSDETSFNYQGIFLGLKWMGNA